MKVAAFVLFCSMPLLIQSAEDGGYALVAQQWSDLPQSGELMELEECWRKQLGEEWGQEAQKGSHYSPNFFNDSLGVVRKRDSSYVLMVVSKKKQDAVDVLDTPPQHIDIAHDTSKWGCVHDPRFIAITSEGDIHTYVIARTLGLCNPRWVLGSSVPIGNQRPVDHFLVSTSCKRMALTQLNELKIYDERVRCLLHHEFDNSIDQIEFSSDEPSDKEHSSLLIRDSQGLIYKAAACKRREYIVQQERNE